jgi:hypothetical protein
MFEREDGRLWFSMLWSQPDSKGVPMFVPLFVTALVLSIYAVFLSDLDAFYEQWMTTLRAAIGYKPDPATIDILVNSPENRRAFVVVSKQFLESQAWEVVPFAGSCKGRPWTLIPTWLQTALSRYGLCAKPATAVNSTHFCVQTDKTHATELTWEVTNTIIILVVTVQVHKSIA